MKWKEITSKIICVIIYVYTSTTNFTWFLSSVWPVWPVAVACNWAARILDLSKETWWDNGTLGSNVGVGLIPRALLWASNEATVFFFGFETPRPRFLGRPSLWWVVLALSLSSLPLLGRCGESAAANNCANEGLGDAGTGTEFCGTLRGFGPGFLLAVKFIPWCSRNRERNRTRWKIIPRILFLFVKRRIYRWNERRLWKTKWKR